jgi:hypothetical protein
MYQAFTGEAMKMLKARKGEEEILALLYDRYVKEVDEKQASGVIVVNTQYKRAYQKRDTAPVKSEILPKQLHDTVKGVINHPHGPSLFCYYAA